MQSRGIMESYYKHNRMNPVCPTTWLLSTASYPISLVPSSNAVSHFWKDGMLVFNTMSSSSQPYKVILTMGDFCLPLGY